jgi:hypothetical protein
MGGATQAHADVQGRGSFARFFVSCTGPAQQIDEPMDASETSSVVTLPKQLRYEHFIRRVADTGRVWGLVRDGWAIGKTDDGALVFPLWPTSELAQQCAVLEWEGYVPQEFDLQELFDELLPQIEADGILPGITYTPDEYGLTPSHAQLRADLQARLRQIGAAGQAGGPE